MATHGCIRCSKCGAGCPLCGRCSCKPEEGQKFAAVASTEPERDKNDEQKPETD